MNKFKQVERISISDQVRDQILSWLSKNTSPGTRLPPEREIASLMGVSRSLIREVLQGLVMENILETKQGGGYFVQYIDVNTIAQSTAFFFYFGTPTLDELYEARVILETMITKLAAVRATEAEIEQMDRILQESELSLANGHYNCELGWAFHNAIAKASHNKAFRKLTEMITHLGKSTHFTLDGNYPWLHEVKSHRKVWKFILNRDPDGASQAMEEHLKETYSLLAEVNSNRSEASANVKQ
jgi:GntR family transcriptional repressor for pyruvate dehydrogenase complex